MRSEQDRADSSFMVGAVNACMYIESVYRVL